MYQQFESRNEKFITNYLQLRRFEREQKNNNDYQLRQ